MSKLYKYYTSNVSDRNLFVTSTIDVELVQETVRIVMDSYDPDSPVSIYDAVMARLCAGIDTEDAGRQN